MSRRDVRNWLVLIFVSSVFSCGYLYGRICVLQEFEDEIGRFSMIMNNTYESVCMRVTSLKME